MKNLTKFIVAFIAVIAFGFQANAQLGVQNNTGGTIDVAVNNGNSVLGVTAGNSSSDPNMLGTLPTTTIATITCGGTNGTATFTVPNPIPSPYYTQVVAITGGGCAGNTATIFYYPTTAFVIQVD